MGVIVPRTVTRFRPDGTSVGGLRLSAFRDAPFYVLLGEPGAGKTTVFGLESGVGDHALHLPARKFVRRHLDPKPEWRGKTLFIDGLDEVRAGSRDIREALDRILAGLDRLGQPRARLSCRSAAWLATNDLKAIRSIGYQDPLILHLDPLTGQEAQAILDDQLGGAAKDFFTQARKQRLHYLLDNPLSLELLVRAMGSDQGWPESRTETFERACVALVEEQNQEHAIACRYDPILSRDALDAASRMVVLLLLADKEAIAWDRTDVSKPDNLLLVGEIDSDGGSSVKQMRWALDSGLFATRSPRTSATPTLSAFVPMHPHVAEYLAARHLARAVERGAVLERVLTLLTAGGGVPSPLRGVAAWLAALCPDARRALVDADPVGIVAYGDMEVFSENERAHLLLRLSEHDRPGHDLMSLGDTPLVGLVSPGTLADLHKQVNDRDPSDVAQNKVALLLRGVAAAPSRCHGQLSNADLLSVARRDAAWPVHVRVRAVSAATRLPNNSRNAAQRLQLLREVNEGSVSDPTSDIRTLLFGSLYPKHIRPEDAWNWIEIPVHPWLASTLLSRSEPVSCPALLDALRVRAAQADHIRDPSLTGLTWRILANALEADGEALGISKLYDWIELAALDTPRGSDGRRDDAGFDQAFQAAAERALGSRVESDMALSGAPRVQAWLAQRPSVQKALLLEFFRRNRHREDEFVREAGEFWQVVSAAGRPYDFHEWCIKQALAMSSNAEEAACWFVEWAVEPIRQAALGDEWLATGLEWVGADSILSHQLRGLAKNDKEKRRRELEYATRRQDNSANLASKVVEHRDALLAGAGPEQLLVALGQAYWGRPFLDHPATGDDRLRNALSLSMDAARIALQALVAVPNSDAGPDISDITGMVGDGRSPAWGLPFLAGLDVIDRQGASVVEVLGDRFVRALWFHFATPHGQEMPRWFADALEVHPDQVAKVIVKLYRHQIRSKRDDATTLSAMTEDDRYGPASRLALPALLRAFPAKGYGVQLDTLRHVLALAIRYMPDEVAARVRNRLDVRRMNTAQRATWLAAGVAVAPGDFVADAVAFLEKGKDERTKHMVAAFHALWKKGKRGAPLFDRRSSANAVATLVGILGAKRPSYWDGLEINAPAFAVIEDEGGELVDHLINCLANNPTREAGMELDSLSRDADLEGWRGTISRATERQRILQRDAEHHVPTVEQVQSVLSGGLPASAADLTALVVAQLERLGEDIRHGSTNDWQQYWNERRVNKFAEWPPTPKQENACRDVLLSALNRCLPPGVDARREASYAENARADVRVCYGLFGIPIEIKKGDDRKLWSAIRDQLIAKYVRDPESDGHGIYLMLWFGAYGRAPVKTPPTRPRPERPQSPGELARRLEEGLSEEERSRIKVVVIDVSWPGPR